MLMDISNHYEKLLPDVLPAGSCFNLQVQDAGKVFNQESGIDWAKPGEFIQYTLTHGPLEIRIMRIATFRDDISYCVVFDPDGWHKPLGDRLTFDDLKAAVRRYLDGKMLTTGGGG